MSVSPLGALPLFFAMLVPTELGRKLHSRAPHQKPSSAIEGAIFGLFGLLLAFTFSGAIARYDTHRRYVIEEVNDIRAAYLRLDLLPKELQPEFRQDFRDYVASRLDRFDSAANRPASAIPLVKYRSHHRSQALRSKPAAELTVRPSTVQSDTTARDPLPTSPSKPAKRPGTPVRLRAEQTGERDTA